MTGENPARMELHSGFNSKKKRGRPPTKGMVDKLRVRLWYRMVEMRSGKTPNKLEKEFSYVVIRGKKPAADKSELTGKWKQYRKGAVRPDQILICEVERKYPGTQFLLEHPIWDILRSPIQSDTDYNIFLHKLRPEIISQLYRKISDNGCIRLERHPYSDRVFDKLIKICDIDSLAACLAITQEASRIGHVYPYYISAHAAIKIFLDICIFLPMHYISNDFFTYMKEHCFSLKAYKIFDIQMAEVNVGAHQRIRMSIIGMMEDLGLLKYSAQHHLACLYMAKKIGLNEVSQTIFSYWSTNFWEEARQDPLIRKLRHGISRMKPSSEQTDSRWP